jgi:hypothetical protein
MQRLLTLVFLLCLAIPAGISISGCSRNPAGAYCNGSGYGLKLTDVASIDLEPRTTGVSLSFGQTQQLASPTAKTCKGNTASVSTYTYGTTNNQLVDISPTGNLCAGTWNRRSGGGIPDYTICNFPSPLPSTNNLPYAQAYVTATANSVTSNQVEVYVHAQVTAISLVLEQVGTTTPFTGCLSQTQTAQLDSQAFYSSNSQQTLLCEPNSSKYPSCSTAIGNLAYTAQTPTIASIDQFGVITADLPGTTYITASVAGSGSSAGYFSTCPPASINVTLNGQTSGTVTQGVTQNLTTSIIDTKGATIQGLTLDYQSTNPLDISAGASGAITANFAGQATVYAVCQPTTCNPAPIDKIGVNQTGTSITSNSVTITTPGVASSYIWLASPQSQYFVPVELLTGTVGSTIKMPYIPNSMIMDRLGNSLYFGSSHELMIYAAASNSLTKEDTNVPGKVLAVSPDNQKLLINDPIRKLFYIYLPSGGTYTTFSGVGTSAQWTPDAKTLYIVGTDYSNSAAGVPTLFVNNVNTGWTTYPLAAEGQTSDFATNVAITVPGVGAFLSGQPTVANAWCPSVSASSGDIIQAYPQAATVAAQTDVLAATTDGAHILGVGLNGGTTPTLTDISLNIPASLYNGACTPNTTAGATVGANTGITFATQFVQSPLSFQASSINQIVPSPATDLAFFTYTPSGAGSATLPYYQPNASGSLGTFGAVTLTGSPTAPIVGAFSLDDTLFFVSTSGDNLVHYISVPTLTDTKQIKPGLIDPSGNSVPASFIAVKPRTTT